MKQLRLQSQGHGGAREGAGRKRKKDSGVRHRARAAVSARHPLHITVRMLKGAPSLRSKRAFRVFTRACRGAREYGLRVLHYAVLGNHFHILVEADSNEALSRGMRSLNIRVARGLNALSERIGAVQEDRFDVQTLSTPTQMKNALVYVFTNAAKHGGGRKAFDAYNSYVLFEGEVRVREGWDWRKPRFREIPEHIRDAVTESRSWLAREGWRRGAW